MNAKSLFKVKAKEFREETDHNINKSGYNLETPEGLISFAIIFGACVLAEAIRNDVMDETK